MAFFSASLSPAFLDRCYLQNSSVSLETNYVINDLLYKNDNYSSFWIISFPFVIGSRVWEYIIVNSYVMNHQ